MPRMVKARNGYSKMRIEESSAKNRQELTLKREVVGVNKYKPTEKTRY